MSSTLSRGLSLAALLTLGACGEADEGRPEGAQDGAIAVQTDASSARDAGPPLVDGAGELDAQPAADLDGSMGPEAADASVDAVTQPQDAASGVMVDRDRKSTRLNSS